MKVIKIEEETDKNITFLCNRVGCTKKNFVKIIMEYLTYEQLGDIWNRKIHGKNKNRTYLKDNDINTYDEDELEELEENENNKKVEWEELNKVECSERKICYYCHKTIENCECDNLDGFPPTHVTMYKERQKNNKNAEEEDEEIEWNEDDDVIDWEDDNDEENEEEEWEELSEQECIERKICFGCHRTIKECVCGNLDGFPPLGDDQLS